MNKIGMILLSALMGIATGVGLIGTFFALLIFSYYFSGFAPANETLSAYEEAMKKYVEEKYDENVTCHECVYEYDSDCYEGTFVSNKYQDVTFSCSVYKDKQSGTYKFTDDYQANLYLSDVQEHMEKTAEKYFKGEYYVVVETRGEDDDSVDIMLYEECTGRYGQYCVYIYEYGMTIDEAYDAMEKFVADVESQGFQYSFYLGRSRKVSKEDYLAYIQGNAEFGWKMYIEWLYYKWLPPQDKNMKPKIFMLMEGNR